ncbi:MAG: efflux RND transporter periplasmic adaptor subunit [Magnetococcales bacterium]|nr:efflux RND transporter periplasmic adaptor subunit [Magnetococcales bacterium]
MEPAPIRCVPSCVLLLSMAVLSACSAEKTETKTNPATQPVPVMVAPVMQKNVPLTLQAMGNAETCHAVSIKARVDGELLKSHITDGQEVQQGQALFDLDDRPYQHRLKQLKANLDRDLALLENARSKEQRQAVLNKQNIASEETLTALVSSRQAAEATVSADRAALAEGEMQLGFTRITAPLTGMAGRILIQPGNLIKANDANPLVTLHQMDPMCITFTVAEPHLNTIRANHAKKPLTLEIFPNRENDSPIPGTLLSLDNAVDRQTGTIRLKAQARNEDRRLWPGLFVTLSLKLIDRPEALVIPTRAVLTGSAGPFVYVVKADQSVETRALTITKEDKEETVITSGVAAGETVVTVGQWRLKPGSQVELPKTNHENTNQK